MRVDCTYTEFKVQGYLELGKWYNWEQKDETASVLFLL